MSDQSSASESLDRRVWTVAAAVIVGMIMVILDTTIVSVALETLSRDLDSSLSSIQWVASGYLLSLALVIPPSGWMTERFGSKRVWMVSLSLFAIFSALCGLAWSSASLIFFRVLQGLGGGMIMPVGMSLLTQTAGPKRVGRVMSVVGVPILLAPILGPVIGGAIVGGASWRWIFYVNVPVAAIALALAVRLLDADSGRADAGRLDWRGFLLVSPGLVALVFGLSEIQDQGGIDHPIALGPMVAGLILLSAFAGYSYRAPKPLIDVGLFRSRAFSAASATTFIIGAALFGAMLLFPLYYQLARGEGPLEAGLLMAPQGVGAALVMPIAGRLTDRIGGGQVAVFGTALLALATVPFAFVGPNTPYGLLAGALVVRGIGLGCAMMPAMAAAFSALETPQVPRATSALNSVQRVGGAVGTALLAVVLQHQLAAVTTAPSDGAAGVHHVAAAPTDVAGAFGSTFWWAVGLTVLAIVPATMLAVTQRRDRLRASTQPAGAVA